MTEHQKQTAFLRRIIHFEGTDQCLRMEESIARVQRDERCVQRAAWLMALLTLLAVAGLWYGAVLLGNFPYNQAQVVIKALCVVGLSSLVCLLAFLGLLMIYRSRLNRLRAECRQMVTKLLESRPNMPHITGAADQEAARSSAESIGSPDRADSLGDGVVRGANKPSLEPSSCRE